MSQFGGLNRRRVSVAALSVMLASSLLACSSGVGVTGESGVAAGAPRVLTQGDAVADQVPLGASASDGDVRATRVVGAKIQGSQVTGSLADLIAQRDGVSYVTNAVVTSNLGDALDGLQATNTSFLEVDGTREDTRAVVSGADLSFSDSSSGANGNDYTGLGAVFTTVGAPETTTRLELKDANIVTEGFMRDAIVSGDHADVLMSSCNILTAGNNPLKEAYGGYVSSGAKAFAISPPWTLGVYGGVRTANVVGAQGSLTVSDSSLESGSWAVLSADSCDRPTINVVDSTLSISGYDGDEQAGNSSKYSMNGGSALFGYERTYGSGCGLYGSGGMYGNLLGATVDGTTYASVLEGAGKTYFGASTKNRMLRNEATGAEVLSYGGSGQETVVNSLFGVMSRGGVEQVTLDAGSVWNTEEASMLVSGPQRASYVVRGARLRPRSGVLFQMMDCDEGYGTSFTGGDSMGAQGFRKWNGEPWGTPAFSSGFRDPNEAGFKTPTAGGAYDTTLSLERGDDGKAVTYKGNILNGTGSGKGAAPGGLAVTLGQGVTLEGAITSTSSVHGLPYSLKATAYLDELAEQYGDKGVAPNGGTPYTVRYTLLDNSGKATKDPSKAVCIQVNEFTMGEYYLISHVMNRSMAGANVLVTVGEGATWNVTQDCYVKGLINKGTIKVAKGATLYVNGAPYDGTAPQAGEVPQPPGAEAQPNPEAEGSPEGADSEGEEDLAAQASADSWGEGI